MLSVEWRSRARLIGTEFYSSVHHDRCSESLCPHELDSLRVGMSKQVYAAGMAIGPGPGPVILTDVFAFCWRIQWSVCMFVCFIVSAFCNGWMYLCMHIY